MSKFLSRLAMQAASDEDDGKWILTEPLLYSSDIANCTIVVPRGFVTDLASAPRLPVIYFIAGDVAAAAAVTHDFLYSSHQFSRSVADAIFREAAEVTGVSWFQRWAMWAGVRIGGASRYG